MSKSSRRGFLKSASATAAALAVSQQFPSIAGAQSGAGQVRDQVRMWSTYRDKRHAAGEPLAWKPAAAITAGAIVLDPKRTRQEVLGFGGALTDATCYVLSQMSESEREAAMHDLFAPGEMAFNVCRTCIGASDYS